MKKPTNPSVIADAIAKGYPVQHAHVIGDLDAALEGHDAAIALPVLILMVDNIAAKLLPAAQEQVAGLLSDTAYQIAERARVLKEAAARDGAADQPQENHDAQPEKP